MNKNVKIDCIEEMDLSLRHIIDNWVSKLEKEFGINQIRDFLLRYRENEYLWNIFQEYYQFYDSLCDDYFD